MDSRSDGAVAPPSMTALALSAEKALSPFRHAANHIGVALATKFVPLASIFLYSRFMSIEDYGIVSIFASYVWMFAISMSLNLHTAIGRYIYLPGARLEELVGTTMLALAALLASSIAVVATHLDEFASLLRLPKAAVVLLLFVVVGQLAESIYMQIAVARQESSKLLRLTCARALMGVAATLLLLAVLQSERYLSVLIADASLSAAFCAVVAWRVRKDVAWVFRRHLMAYIAKYSLPLIPYVLSLTLLVQFDRVMIDQLFGKEAAGLYSLAFNAGILLVVVVGAVLNTFTPSFFDSMERGNYAKVIDQSRGVYQIAVVCTTVIVAFGPDAATWLLPSKYADSFSIIPIVALGGLASVIFQIWGRVIIYSHKTHVLAIIAVAATTLKIGLNFWLLPIFGYKLAAFTTVVAYLLMGLLCLGAVNGVVRLFRIALWGELTWLAALSALACLLLYGGAAAGIAWAIKLAATAGVAAIALRSLAWRRQRGPAPSDESPSSMESPGPSVGAGAARSLDEAVFAALENERVIDLRYRTWFPIPAAEAGVPNYKVMKQLALQRQFGALYPLLLAAMAVGFAVTALAQWAGAIALLALPRRSGGSVVRVLATVPSNAPLIETALLADESLSGKPRDDLRLRVRSLARELNAVAVLRCIRAHVALLRRIAQVPRGRRFELFLHSRDAFTLLLLTSVVRENPDVVYATDDHYQRWAYLLSTEGKGLRIVQHGVLDDGVAFPHRYGFADTLYCRDQGSADAFGCYYTIGTVRTAPAARRLTSKPFSRPNVFLASTFPAIDAEIDLVTALKSLTDAAIIVKFHPAHRYDARKGNLAALADHVCSDEDCPDCSVFVSHSSSMELDYRAFGIPTVSLVRSGSAHRAAESIMAALRQSTEEAEWASSSTF